MPGRSLGVTLRMREPTDYRDRVELHTPSVLVCLGRVSVQSLMSCSTREPSPSPRRRPTVPRRAQLGGLGGWANRGRRSSTVATRPAATCSETVAGAAGAAPPGAGADSRWVRLLDGRSAQAIAAESSQKLMRAVVLQQEPHRPPECGHKGWSHRAAP